MSWKHPEDIDDYDELSEPEKDRRSCMGCIGLAGMALLTVVPALIIDPYVMQAHIFAPTERLPVEVIGIGIVVVGLFSLAGKKVGRWIKHAPEAFYRDVSVENEKMGFRIKTIDFEDGGEDEEE